MALSNINALDISQHVPVELQPTVLASWRRVGDAIKEASAADARVVPDLLPTLPKVLAASPFVVEQCSRDASLLTALVGGGSLFRGLSPGELRVELARGVGCVDDEAQLMAQLRRFRNAQMVRIAWRDIAGWADLDETLGELSGLAEACINVGLDWLFSKAAGARGTPLTAQGEAQQLIVLGMGKLGAWELNFSSDIDLIFAFERDGVLTDRREISYGEFYSRLARSLVKVLDEPTSDGFVFRVDTRLRPFGESGPLVMSFDGMEHYYQTQAREWERYAMVKARAVAGDASGGRRLEKLLQPFVYRRYLDYRAFGELRELKEKIALELRRRDRLDDVKLGPGGIREVEFIGQAFQLIRGGQEKALRARGIQPVLEQLGVAGHLPVTIVTKLSAAYRFLRLVENRIQEYGDRQTHDLPVDAVQRASLAYALGFSGWDVFRVHLDSVRQEVHEVFEQVFESPHITGAQGPAVAWVELDTPLLETVLQDMGFRHVEELAVLLHKFLRSAAVKRMTARGITELNRLLPMLLGVVRRSANEPIDVVVRLLTLLETIASRNVYLTLLVENPLALGQLVKLAAASSWITAYIAAHPLLLDELLDPNRLYSPLTRQQLSAELRCKLDNVDPEDPEQFMMALRQFKQQNVLRIASADVTGIIPIMVVSDYLTFLAEVIVSAVLDEAWRLTSERHGVPPHQGEPSSAKGFGVIAYGKMGGLELSYASDLDLVFLYGGVGDTDMTGGAYPISSAQFYARVGKRMINILTTNMLGGALYDVDLRLRPSGSSGLLVSSVEAYESYQLNSAWTWEQQALVRARYVAGDCAIGEAFAAIRSKVLGQWRDTAALRTEVCAMREKMREALAVKEVGVFDLKQGTGGIADIEFIVQFKVLSCAHEHKQLLRWTDVVRLLDSLRDSTCLAADDAAVLRDAYCTYRERTHRAALLDAPAVVADSEYSALRTQVSAIWRTILTPEELT